MYTQIHTHTDQAHNQFSLDFEIRQIPSQRDRIRRRCRRGTE